MHQKKWFIQEKTMNVSYALWYIKTKKIICKIMLSLWNPVALHTLQFCLWLFPMVAKGGFFSESAIRFSNLPISKIRIFHKTILSLKFKFPVNYSVLLLAGNLNFKFRIIFWNIFFWRFEKHIALSEKRPPLKVRKFQKLIFLLSFPPNDCSHSFLLFTVSKIV